MSQNVIDTLRQAQLEREITELVRNTPGDWSEIRVHACGNVHTVGVTTSADVRLPRPPKRVSSPLRELREAMVDSERGAWFTADIVVPRQGDAAFRYDWTTKPDWPNLGGDFEDSHYLDDLAKFPRTSENIPSWFPPRTTANIANQTGADHGSATPPQRGQDPEVPLQGLNWPFGVAVDAAGALYVSDTANNRVVALLADAADPIVLAFSGLREPCGIAVGTDGAIYVADSLNDRVLVLPAGAPAAVELAIPGLRYPGGLAVGTAGDLYVADRGNHRVLKVGLREKVSAPIVLRLNGIRDPLDVAIDHEGTVYVTDGTMHSDNPYSGRLLRLAAGADEAEQSLTGLQSPFGVTIDAAGDVYFSEKLSTGRVLKLVGGSQGALSAAVDDLHHPAGLAMDKAGNIFIAEMREGSTTNSGGRIVKRTLTSAGS